LTLIGDIYKCFNLNIIFLKLPTMIQCKLSCDWERKGLEYINY